MSEETGGEILLATLGRNWWMVGVRGALAILFGASILLWLGLPFNLLVALFGAYAALDGLWAIASALWVSRRSWAAWPVLIEGAVSLIVGALALVSPLVPRQLISVIVLWGLLTGVLEILAATRLSRERPGCWLLATGGVFSLFLALLIAILPHASRPYVAWILGVYALGFGIVLVAAAAAFRRALPAR